MQCVRSMIIFKTKYLLHCIMYVSNIVIVLDKLCANVTYLCHLCWDSLSFNRAITLCDHPTERRSLCQSSSIAASLSSEECSPWWAVYPEEIARTGWAAIWNALDRRCNSNGKALHSTILGLWLQMNYHTVTDLLLSCVCMQMEWLQGFQNVAWRQTAR